MDGISAATTAIGLITNAKVCWDVLQLYYTRVATAGQTLTDMDFEFGLCVADLETWKDNCRLDSGVSLRYQRELWGATGSVAVVSQLIKIESEMDLLWCELSGLLSYHRITQRNAPQTIDWKSVEGYRNAAKKAQKSLGISTLWRMARGKGDELSSKITLVKSAIAELENRSNKYISQRHGLDLLQKAPEAVSHEIAMDAFVSAAAEARIAASMYFDAFVDLAFRVVPSPGATTPLTSTQFELGVVPNPEDATPSKFESSVDNYIKLKYHLSLIGRGEAVPGRPAQMLVYGPYSFTVPSNNKNQNKVAATQPVENRSIDYAYNELRQSRPCEFMIRDIDGTAAQFHLRPVSKHDKIFPSIAKDKRVEECLRDILTPLPTSSRGQQNGVPLATDFGRSERILFAQQLVISSLFLCGSPWFAVFQAGGGSRNIRRSKLIDPSTDLQISKDDPRYLLDVDVNMKGLTASNYTAMARQIFFVGLVLIEIGMGRPLAHERKTPTDGGPAFEFENPLPAKEGRAVSDRAILWLLHKLILVASSLLVTLLRRVSLDAFVSTSIITTPHMPPTTIKSEKAVYEHLELAIGMDYAAAVRTCVDGSLWREANKATTSPSPTQRKNIENKILKTYWLQVCARIEEVVRDGNMDGRIALQAD